MHAQPKPDHRGLLHGRIIRASAYSVASVLAVLMLTASLPPLVADQSDRAILDAPVTLVTSPIAGEVATLGVSAGAQIDKEQIAATVTNARVDRTTLVTLEGKAASAREALQAARMKRASDLRYIQAIDQQIQAQKTQLIAQFEMQTTELKGQLASAQSLVAEKNALRDRQVNLVARNVSDPYMLKPTSQQLSGAEGMRQAAAAKMTANVAQLSAVKQDIFVGDNLIGIATLAQKRRDLSFDADRQSIESSQAESTLASNTKLVDDERQRIDRMSRAVLPAPSNGQVVHVGVSLGRHVNAGDALVNLVDCDKLFAVAIFSYREATELAVGTPMTITVKGRAPVRGTVSEVLPKSSDTSDALFAMPFPQTERREMYVLVKPDDGAQSLRTAEGSGGDRPYCPVGKWVTVTRPGGWMPSSSVVWAKTTGALVSFFSGLVAGNADAHPRKSS